MFTFSQKKGNKINIEGYSGGEPNDNVIVPSKINNFYVVGLTSSAFEGEENFIGVVELSHGIEIIGEGAFRGCPNLERIILSSSITQIDDFAFEDCESLQEVVFMGNAPRRVGKDIFKGSELVEVSYLPYTMGWAGTTFGDRPLRPMSSPEQSLGEEGDDDSAGEIVNMGEDEFKEARYFAEDKASGDELWHHEETEYKAEMKAYERTGFMYTKTTSLKNVAKPSDAFKMRLTHVFDTKRSILTGLTKTDFENMVEAVWLIENIEFKNPVAYMLGYYVVVANKVNAKRLKIASDALEQIAPQGEIAPVDILRYAFYWIEVLKPAMNTE